MRKWAPLLVLLFYRPVAQPLVHQESHHVPVAENRHARVLNVTAAIGDTTDFHIHQNDIAYFTIRGTRVWLEELGKEGRIVQLPTGWKGSNLTHDETPLVHRFANVGDADFQLIAVEVLSAKYSETPFTQLGEVLFEDERFNMQEGRMDRIKCDVPWVLLEMDVNGEVMTLDLFRAGRGVKLSNTNESSSRVVIQLK